jgi:hypothetical protein
VPSLVQEKMNNNRKDEEGKGEVIGKCREGD